MSDASLRDGLDDLASPASVAWAIAGAAVGAAVAIAVLPNVLPLLTSSLAAPQPKLWWHLARVSGIIAYALLTTSMLLGLSLSTRFAKAWPGSARAFVLHEHASVLSVAFALFHALVLLGDRHTPFTLAQALTPFGAAYRSAAVGLGQLALYGSALLVASFYVRKRIGQRVWRFVHYASFGVFVLALVHAWIAGTDRAVMTVASAPAAAVLFFSVYRVLEALVGEKPRARRAARSQ